MVCREFDPVERLFTPPDVCGMGWPLEVVQISSSETRTGPSFAKMIRQLSIVGCIRDGRTDMFRIRSFSVVVVALLAALALTACQSNESSTEFIDNIEPADVLYNQALANVDAGNTSRALKKLEELDRQHPYSEYSRKALIMQTYLTYRQQDYDQTTQFGQRYVSLYPGDRDAAYAQYLVGMAYFRQMPDITRDQTVTARAYNAMLKLTEQYPDSEYVDDANNKMLIARDQLGGKEMLTGRYYLERREYLAAINRFRTVVEKYQRTRHVEEALARLTEAYFALGLASEAQAAAAVLGHNFPDSEWYRDSVALLSTGGLEPRSNPNSWLAAISGGLSDSDT